MSRHSYLVVLNDKLLSVDISGHFRYRFARQITEGVVFRI